MEQKISAKECLIGGLNIFLKRPGFIIGAIIGQILIIVCIVVVIGIAAALVKVFVLLFFALAIVMPALLSGIYYVIHDVAADNQTSLNRLFAGLEKVSVFFFMYLLLGVIFTGVILAFAFVIEINSLKEFVEYLQQMNEGNPASSGAAEMEMPSIPIGTLGAAAVIALLAMFSSTWIIMLGTINIAFKGASAMEAISGAVNHIAANFTTAVLLWLAFVSAQFPIELLSYGAQALLPSQIIDSISALASFVVSSSMICVGLAFSGVTSGAAAAAGAIASSQPSAGPEPFAGGQAVTKYRPGEYAHCFVFSHIPDMDNDKAWAVVMETHSEIADKFQDMGITGGVIIPWPKTKESFISEFKNKIRRYVTMTPAAPDFMDSARFRMKVKLSKDNASGAPLAFVFVTAV